MFLERRASAQPMTEMSVNVKWRNLKNGTSDRTAEHMVWAVGCFAVLFLVSTSILVTNLPDSAEGIFLRRSQLRRPVLIDDPAIQNLQHQFPVHVNDDDYEEIQHPGLAFAGGIERIRVLLPENVDFPQTLSVPKFWNPPEYGPAGVREFLGEHGRRLMSPTEVQSIGSKHKGKGTIFVSVASYRDSECLSTVESLFERAKYPDRIRVAIIDQVDEDDPRCGEPKLPCTVDPMQTLCKYGHLVDSMEFPAYTMVGPVLARHVAHRMYRGEYFAMQIDAHVRFTQDWDEDIVAQWNRTGNEMAVISTYMTDISGSIDPSTHASMRTDRNMLCHLHFDGSGQQSRLVLAAPSKSIPKVQNSPMLHPFWSAGFSFGRGHFVVQVPYDQHLPMVFQGEEGSIAIRGFTYGYDFYAPIRSVVFHIFAIKENIGRRTRHKFWENDTLYAGALQRSMLRLNGITGMSGGSIPDYFHDDEQQYGLGKIRTKEMLFGTFGIDPRTQSVQKNLCHFVQNEMHQSFSIFLRDDGMGVDYDKINFQFRDPFGWSN